MVVPCSGIGKTFGSVAREAAYEVCDELRPDATRLVALSKLVLGDEQARDRVRHSATITIDGCKLMCAAKLVKHSGGTIAREVSVLDVYRQHKELKPDGIAELQRRGQAARTRSGRADRGSRRRLAAKRPVEAVMVSLPHQKVGIVACSGEELAEGTVTRLAALKVLHELQTRPNSDDLSAAVPGGRRGRPRVREAPPDHHGGWLRSQVRRPEAPRCTPASRRPASSSASLRAEHAVGDIQGRRSSTRRGRRAVALTAERLARWLMKSWSRPAERTGAGTAAETAGACRVVMCSCGSGIPVTRATIDGRVVELLALPLIFRQFQRIGRSRR